MAYVYQEFPKWKYRAEGRPVVVQNAEQEAALVGQWFDTPDLKNFKEVVELVVERVAEPEPVVEMPKSRRRSEPKFDEN